MLRGDRGRDREDTWKSLKKIASESMIPEFERKYRRGKMSTIKRLKDTSYSGNQEASDCGQAAAVMARDGDEARRRAGKVTHSVSIRSGYRRQ